MIATDGRPTIANERSYRVTSVTLPSGVQEYIVKDWTGQEVGPRFVSMALAMREIQLLRKRK